MSSIWNKLSKKMVVAKPRSNDLMVEEDDQMKVIRV